MWVEAVKSQLQQFSYSKGEMVSKKSFFHRASNPTWACRDE